MNLTIITDTIPHIQVNGVSRTINALIPELQNLNHNVTLIDPSMFPYFSLPKYNEIKVPYYVPFKKLDQLIPKDSHIWLTTEFILGHVTKRWCASRNRNFSTAFFTDFAAQLKSVINLPPSWTWSVLRRFHRQSKCITVATSSVKELLQECGFKNNIQIISKGVDCNLFKPYPRKPREKPVAIFVGRISKEKNIEAFLECKNDVKKIIIGDGPLLPELKQKYKNVEFSGYLHGEELARAYSDADVFVMPSKTETFGLVTIEALACSCPVAGFPIFPGNGDIIKNNEKIGILDWNLSRAIESTLKTADRDACRQYALQNYQWKNVAKKLVDCLIY